MLAISLDDAKSIAVGLVGVFLVGSVLAAWIVKSIIQKILVTVVLVLFAFAAWTQRTSLQDCADKVREVYELDGDARLLDTDCSFFGFDTKIPERVRPGGDALATPTATR